MYKIETIIHSILLILSIISLIKCKIFKLKTATYSISLPSSNGQMDFRGKYITDLMNPNKNLNIVRSTNFLNSIKYYFKNPNVIFFLSFKYFFSYKKYNNLLLETDTNLQSIFEKIFLFLGIKKFISIDDQRVIGLFLNICEDNNIKSIGYMHYRFDKTYKIMKIKTFQIFFVWSSFFKKKLLEINSNYKKKIFITGINYYKFRNKKKIIDLLIILDLNTDYNFINKFSKKLKKKGFNIAIKFKPSSNKDNLNWVNFCKKNDFLFFKTETFKEIREEYVIKFFLAHSSTALYESCLYGAEPILVNNKSKIALEIRKENIIRNAPKNYKLFNIIKKKPSKKNIRKQKSIFWSGKRININKLKFILNKQ